LAQRIEEAMADLKAKTGRGVFVRSDVRSPKDSTFICPFSTQRSLEILERKIEQQMENHQQQKQVADEERERASDMLTLDEYRLALESFIEGRECLTGMEAVQLLVHSSRMFSDFSLALEYPEDFRVKIALREWRDMTPEMEFQGLMYNKKLTAITQANEIFCFDSLCDDSTRNSIETAIKECFEKVKDALPYNNAVLDFIYFPNGETLLIELNPWDPNTAVALFDWCQDERMMEEGPFQFRYRKQPLPVQHLRGLLRDRELRQIIDDARTRIAQRKSATSTSTSTATSTSTSTATSTSTSKQAS
jgi:hypothetical protein